MSKKVLTLIEGITMGVATVASAIVTFCQPSYAGAIVASIDIGATAVIAICTQFVKAE